MCFVLPGCLSPASEGKKGDVWDHLSPISLSPLPKDRSCWAKKMGGVSSLRYSGLSALSASLGTATKFYILAWELLPLHRPARAWPSAHGHHIPLSQALLFPLPWHMHKNPRLLSNSSDSTRIQELLGPFSLPDRHFVPAFVHQPHPWVHLSNGHWLHLSNLSKTRPCILTSISMAPEPPSSGSVAPINSGIIRLMRLVPILPAQ